MKSLQPEQGTFLMQMWMPSLKNEHRLTKSVIEAIPRDKGDYRPDPTSKTALAITTAGCWCGPKMVLAETTTMMTAVMAQ